MGNPFKTKTGIVFLLLFEKPDLNYFLIDQLFLTLLYKKMTRAFVPPVQHGMKILNREAFKKTVSTLAMRVQAKHVGGLMKNLSRF